MIFEDQVRERAYHIWLSGGMADGAAHEHWAMAEQAMQATAPVVILTKTAAATPKAAATSKMSAKSKASAKAPAKAAKPAVKSATRKVARGESTAAC